MSDKDIKGTSKIGDNEYDFHATNVRDGTAPDTIWIAVERKGGLALVALVGWADSVIKLPQRLRKLSKLPLLPMGLLEIDSQHFGVCFAGLWPQSLAEGIVRQLSGNGAHTHRGWAKEYRRLLNDPDRQSAGVPDTPQCQELVHLFVLQCMYAEGRVTPNNTTRH